jgi:hypothetical protein
MSTAAQTATQDPKVSPEAKAPSTSGYSIARSLGKCAVCSRAFAVGEKYFAAVRETPMGLERVDVSAECWDAFDKSPLLAFWHATLPAANAQKPKVFVDDTVLCDLFERLGSSTEESAKLNFRFVLGLILMRKRLLIYDSTRIEAGNEFWTVRLKGRTETFDLLNPKLTEDQIAEVSGQLGQILNGDPA